MNHFLPELEQARAVQREAAARGASLLPCGRRSRLLRHEPGARPDLWLEMHAMRGLVWLDPADQTCEVGAGTAPAELARELAPHGLMLGADAPCAETGSLGGLFLAPDMSLLHRAAGPPRDQVLGGSWLLADGSLVRTGARVVKSVAGYDLTRLFLGSRGRLAACVTLVLRLQPQPRDHRCFRVADPQALRAANLPDPDWFFQADASSAMASWQGFAPRHETLQPCSEEEFHAARARCLAAFAACPTRVAHAEAPSHRPRGPFDWNALQEGAAADAVLPAGASRVPLLNASPWLAKIAAACAPSAVPYGCRAGGAA